MIQLILHSAKRSLFIVFTLVFITGWAFTQILPDEGTDSGLGGENIISGTVLSATGGRFTRRIQVRLSTAMRGDRTTMTDDKGNFAFRGVPNGNYTVVIDKEKDFEPFSRGVDVIQYRGFPPSTYNVSISLIPKQSDMPKPGVISAEFAGVPKVALDHYTKGLELAKTREVRPAIEEFKQAIALHPEFSHAFNEMGVQHMRLNENEQAAAAFKSALKIDPDAIAPLTNLGISLFNLKQYADAEPVLRAVLKLDGSSAVGHFFLGQSLANQGKFDEAEKELKIAIKDGDPKMREAHRILAIIYSTRGEKEKVATELETYLKLNPNAADAAQLRQMILQARGMTAPTPTKP